MPEPGIEQQLAALQRSYVERLPERVDALRAEAAALVTRWDAVRAAELQRQLHNLAGSGASYGHPEVSRAARAAEDACTAAALPALLSAIEALARAIPRHAK